MIFHIADVDISDNGFQCKNRCGTDGIFKGKYWCYTFDSTWDYCTPYHYGRVFIPRQKGTPRRL